MGASISGSNHNIPAPNDTLPTIITKFKLKGLDLVDLVALSGIYIYIYTVLEMALIYLINFTIINTLQVATQLGNQGALVSGKGCITRLGMACRTLH